MTQSAHPEGLSMLEKRKIEAEILKEVYETLKQSHGEEVARKTIAESVRRSAIEQARQFASAAPSASSITTCSSKRCRSSSAASRFAATRTSCRSRVRALRARRSFGASANASQDRRGWLRF